MFDKINAAIFDMDGTLIDSMGMWRSVMPDYLAGRGMKMPEWVMEELAGSSFYKCAKILTQRLQIDEPIDEILDKWNRYVENAYQTVPLKPMVQEFLARLVSDGIRMCVATLTDSDNAGRVLKRLGIHRRFEFILTAREVGADKSDPRIFLRSAEILGEKPENCIVFEDSYIAAKTAKRAGFAVCGVYDSWCRAEPREFIDLADYYIRDFGELL